MSQKQKEVKGGSLFELEQSLLALQKLIRESIKVEPPTYVEFHYRNEGLEDEVSYV